MIGRTGQFGPFPALADEIICGPILGNLADGRMGGRAGGRTGASRASIYLNRKLLVQIILLTRPCLHHHLSLARYMFILLPASAALVH